MELSEAVKRDIERGRKVSAIKRLRRETGMGLKQSKDIIDAYGRGPAYQGDSEAAPVIVTGKVLSMPTRMLSCAPRVIIAW